MRCNQLLMSWIIFMSIWAFVAMGYDKRQAKRKGRTSTRKKSVAISIYWRRHRGLFWHANISS